MKTMSELWREAIRTVLDSGSVVDSRNGGSREFIGWSGHLEDITRNFPLSPTRKPRIWYAAAELIWYLSGEQRIEGIHYYAKQYARFANDGIAHGAYGHRWANDQSYHASRKPGDPTTPLDCVLEILAEHDNSRQAILPMWTGGDLAHAYRRDVNDIPCTICIQFLVRSGHLHAVTYMRSQDLWLGMPYDIFCFTCLQMMLADHLGLSYGTYTHNVGSLHIYDQHLDKMKVVVEEASADHGHHSFSTSAPTDIKKLVSMEANMRVAKHLPENTLTPGSLPYNLGWIMHVLHSKGQGMDFVEHPTWKGAFNQ
jgi:thymidylate synthase